jgi:hypothetical protein
MLSGFDGSTENMGNFKGFLSKVAVALFVVKRRGSDLPGGRMPAVSRVLGATVGGRERVWPAVFSSGFPRDAVYSGLVAAAVGRCAGRKPL